MKQNDIKIQIDKFEKIKLARITDIIHLIFATTIFTRNKTLAQIQKKIVYSWAITWLAGVCFAVVRFYFKQILRTIKKLLNL